MGCFFPPVIHVSSQCCDVSRQNLGQPLFALLYLRDVKLCQTLHYLKKNKNGAYPLYRDSKQLRGETQKMHQEISPVIIHNVLLHVFTCTTSLVLNAAVFPYRFSQRSNWKWSRSDVSTPNSPPHSGNTLCSWRSLVRLNFILTCLHPLHLVTKVIHLCTVPSFFTDQNWPAKQSCSSGVV